MSLQELPEFFQENVPLFKRIASDLYRWFIINYAWMMGARASFEAFEQVVILKTPWYNISSAIIDELDSGFLVQIAIAAALTEVCNMVIGAIWKEQARRMKEESRDVGRAEGHAEGRAEGHAQGRAEGRAEGQAEGRTAANLAWREWLQRRTEAEANGLPFNEAPPDAND